MSTNGYLDIPSRKPNGHLLNGSLNKTPNDSPKSLAVSISPTTSSSIHTLYRQHSLSISAGSTVRPSKVLHPTSTGELRILLLENISQGAVEYFKSQGFQVDWFPKAWSEGELLEKIGQYHAIGIRSKTKITEKVLKAASKVCFDPLKTASEPCY
jgi:D-3-phosphoglycerate dehydrogenase / 2-oxoglutarate reductase